MNITIAEIYDGMTLRELFQFYTYLKRSSST